MLIICAWCLKILRQEEPVDGKISHGVCEECMKKTLDDLDEELPLIDGRKNANKIDST